MRKIVVTTATKMYGQMVRSGWDVDSCGYKKHPPFSLRTEDADTEESTKSNYSILCINRAQHPNLSDKCQCTARSGY